jgi:hypothetical protein
MLPAAPAHCHSAEAVRIRLVDRTVRQARAAGAADESAVAAGAGPADLLTKLPVDLLAAVLQQALELTDGAMRNRRIRAVEAEQSARAANALLCVCKCLTRAFRSMLHLRLEAVARVCTASTPGLDCTEQAVLADGSPLAGRPYYAQMLAEERSRHDLKALLEALRFACLHCATDCCAKARRECNLVLSDPTRSVHSSELRWRAVGAGRTGRIKVASGLLASGAPFGPWGQRGLLAANARSTECAISMEHPYFCYASTPYAREGNPYQIACPKNLQVFGPKGYLPLEDVDRQAVSGILTIGDAPASQAAAHMETKPYSAIGCVRKDAIARDKPMPLIVTQMRYCPHSEFLAVVSSSMQASVGGRVVPGRTEVRVYRPRESARRSQLVAELGGVFGVQIPPQEAEDPYTGWQTRYDGGRVEAWFAYERDARNGSVLERPFALSLYVLDASEERRAAYVTPENRGHERLPALSVYVLNDPHFPQAEAAERRRADWAFLPVLDCEGGPSVHEAYARVIPTPYWDSAVCDQALSSFDCSPCGRYQASIWEYHPSPSQTGAVVQWNCTAPRLWRCARVMRTQMPAGRETPRPTLCKINERGDTVVVVFGYARSALASVARELFDCRPIQVRVYSIGGSYVIDTHVGIGAPGPDEDGWFATEPVDFFVHVATVEASASMPVSFDTRRINDRTTSLSPCGRYLLVVVAHAASFSQGASDNGGVAIFDLQAAHTAAAAAEPPAVVAGDGGRRCDWRPHARDMAPRALAWNRAGVWLQTARGVLLVGLV